MTLLQTGAIKAEAAHTAVHLRLYVAGVVALVAGVNAFGPIPLETQVLWFLLPAAAFGLFHGGGDPALAEPVARRLAGRHWYALFGFAYTVLILLAYGLWRLSPLAALAAFLLLAIWHFGHTDSFSGSAAESWARGLLIVALSYAAAPELNLWAYSAFVGDSLPNIEAVTPVSWAVVAASLGVAIAAIWAGHRQSQVQSGLHLAATAALFLLTPPLIAFACYFSLWHSFRHMLTVEENWERRDPSFRRRYLLHAAVNTAMVLAVAGAIALSDLSSGLDSAFLAQITFVGLFCLTVPHFALVDVARHHLAGQDFKP